MPRVTLSTGTHAELVRPSTGPAERGIVLYPDIMGLRPLFDRHVATISETLDWPVCAVEMFPGRESLTIEERAAAGATLDDDHKLADMHAAAAELGADQVCVMGFCMGGMYALKVAPHVFKAVSFYGMIRVPERWRGPGHREPLEGLSPRRGDNVLAIIGSADTYTPTEDVAALKETGAIVVVYDGAEHGFVHDPDRPAHRSDYATDAWRRVYQFLVTP